MAGGGHSLALIVSLTVLLAGAAAGPLTAFDDSPGPQSSLRAAPDGASTTGVSSQGSLLRNNQVLAYYGNPLSAQMGVLGAGDLEIVLDVLAGHARVYDRLNGATGVLPAMHLVYAVAKGNPTENGLNLQRVPDQDLQRYVELTRERGMLLILDIQIGHSSAVAEVERVLPYLAQPHVHLALDPEWAVGIGEVPGVDLGNLDAADINQVQDLLQQVAQEKGLPPKLLIVHQFADSMITNASAIERRPGVDVVISMDGIGTADMKETGYHQIVGREYTQHGGIKLFFDYDSQLMSEATVLSLTPRPSVIIYH